MNFGLDIIHIGGFINNNISIIIIAAVLAVISAAGCAVITMLRKGFMDDIIISAVFGLVFNVLGLLFVFFRKPVWNNLGWIPVVVAWFFLEGNLTFALILIAYAVIWMFLQHIVYERIKVIEE
ncbi:MAG: hypothetical protein IKV86_01095 [Clostridia bacterium]|nr:hypothetical protein [Clostridia bacterium]